MNPQVRSLNSARSGNRYHAPGHLVSGSAESHLNAAAGEYRFMTALGDVVRQVETALCETYCLPAFHEREIGNRILLAVFTGAVDAKGSR